MLQKFLASNLVLLVVTACDTAPTTVAPVTFTQMSAENVARFDAIPDRGGFDFTSRAERAEGTGVHRMVRVAPEGIEDQQRRLVRQCILSYGGTVIAAERTEFADGDIGLLLTCSQ
ncbi:MAG: hypothetical protein P1U53_08840 [Sulfitobacter sp.]|nr:hypothetical protein [Sulfitobacter sp.]